MTWMDSYQPVEDRLREFHDRYRTGRVITTMVSDPGAFMVGDVIIFRAELFRGDELRDTPAAASGYAHQRILKDPPPKKDGSPNYSAPEWTSPWETAETSAVGRALANLGFAPKGARPSFEEVRKADVAASVSPPKARTPAPSDNPPSDDVAASEALMAELVKAAGGRAKAREALNRTCGRDYNPASFAHATEEELTLTLAALQETNA